MKKFKIRQKDLKKLKKWKENGENIYTYDSINVLLTQFQIST